MREAALALLEAPDTALTANQRAARQRGLDEYVASQELNTDQPSANANLGDLFLRQGQVERARAAYERALQLDPSFVGGYVNLADLLRGVADEPGARKVLDRGLAAVPRSADLHHALGLWLVRNADTRGALIELRKAMELDPEVARYSYAYALGLRSVASPAAALEEMKAADARHPLVPDILSALVSMYREAGDIDSALKAARRLRTASPGDPSVDRLIRELDRPGPGTKEPSSPGRGQK